MCFSLLFLALWHFTTKIIISKSNNHTCTVSHAKDSDVNKLNSITVNRRGGLDDAGVNLGNSVNRVAAHNTQMCHVYLLFSAFFH